MSSLVASPRGEGALRRSRFAVVALALLALALPAAAPAKLVPFDPAQTKQDSLGPCLDRHNFDGTTYDYLACGVPDLDQVRATANGFTGLPGDGTMFCAVASTMNWFAYLAQRGFVAEPAVKNWLLQENFSEMSEEIAKLGTLMGTTPQNGTGGNGMLDGITSWLADHGTPKVAIKHLTTTSITTVTKSFTTGGYYSPDPATMGQDAVNGGLVVPVIGFYSNSTDPGTGVTHKRRVGGHLVSLVSATGTIGTTAANLFVHDPWTVSAHDTSQSAYKSENWNLGATAEDTYYWIDDQGAYHSYQATLPPVNGSTSTLLDGYVTIEPKVVESTIGFHINVLRPKGWDLPGPGPIESIRTPGRVIDLALSPEGQNHPFLVKGSSTVFKANPLTGKVSRLAKGPAGASELTFGGPEQKLFVAGGNRLFAFDRKGHKLAQRTLPSKLDELQYDNQRGRLVGLSLATDRLLFFDRALKAKGGLKLAPNALNDGGAPALAIAPGGAILVRRNGAENFVSTKAVAKTSATTAFPRARLITRKIGASPKARGLAVDDDGHLFVSLKGKLVELLPNGKPFRGSKYTGLPAGPIIDVARSFSNFDPQVGPKTLDFVPPELAFPDKPDLTFSAVTAGQFTVRNQGTADAGPFKVSVANPTGGPPETHSFDGLTEGASVSGTYTCGGARAITVDSDGQVDEGNESNNGAVTIRC